MPSPAFRLTRAFQGSRRPLATALVGAALAVTATSCIPTAPNPAGSVSLWSTSVTPQTPAYPQTAALELGVRFYSDVAGTVSALRYYKSSANAGPHTGHLWTSTGSLLGAATFSGETASGWQTVSFNQPVTIAAKTAYVASYSTDTGHYAGDVGYFSGHGHDSGVLHAPKDAGVFKAGGSGFPSTNSLGSNYYVDVVFTPSTKPAKGNGKPTGNPTSAPVVTPTPSDSPTPSPTPSPRPSPTPSPTATPTPTPTATPTPAPTPSSTPTPAPTPTPTPTPTPSSSPSSGACDAGRNVTGGSDPWGGCFPGPNNTGVLPGTTLTAYSGSATLSGAITAKKLVGDFVVSATATITNSEIDGSVRTTGSGTLSMTDVTLIGSRADNEQFSVISGSHITGLRLNDSDGKANFQCSDFCTLTDSWLHDPYTMLAIHYDAVGSNGTAGFTVTHNTISCNNHLHQPGSSGGCSADLGIFGDFGQNNNITVTRNLIVASNDSAGYCLIAGYGETGKNYPNGTNLTYTNNVFQKGPNGHCGQYGPVSYWGAPAGSGNTWSGNTWDDGTALNE